MYRVTSEKIVNTAGYVPVPEVVQGYLLVVPTIGETMVLFCEDVGTRMVTTVVVRVLSSGGTLFVETENSLYRIIVHGRLVRRRGSKRGVESR